MAVNTNNTKATNLKLMALTFNILINYFKEGFSYGNGKTKEII